ncbi:MAG: NAD(P)H-dependent oxidoreductase [Thermoguttaceae bacterium]
MKVLVILGHPKMGSFNHAITQTCCSILEELGHDVCCHDLYREGFDPVLPGDDVGRDASELPESIQKMIAEFKAADGVIFIHPNWWGGPPAILRGWIERVFHHGAIYQFTEKGPISFVGDKCIQIFSTSNTPHDIEVNINGDPIEHFWKVIVFGLLGFKSFERRNFESIILSSPEERAAWLEEVRATIQRRFTA